MSSQSNSGARKSSTLSPGTKWARIFTRSSAQPFVDPLGDGVGLLAARTRGGEVVVGVDRNLCLVGAGERVVDALGVRGKDPGIGQGVDHQGRAADARQVWLRPGLRHSQAP